MGKVEELQREIREERGGGRPVINSASPSVEISSLRTPVERHQMNAGNVGSGLLSQPDLSQINAEIGRLKDDMASWNNLLRDSLAELRASVRKAEIEGHT